jgi:peptide chain release factor 1
MLWKSNGGDAEIADFAKEQRKEDLAKMDTLEGELRTLLLPSDPNDSKNIIVEIRGAVGGDEANLFAGDLLRMYTKYCEAQGWHHSVNRCFIRGGRWLFLCFVYGQRAITFIRNSKFESGAHRVQRVPKTEAAGRIHTSTATVLVMPEAEEVDVQINPADLKIDTYRSQGAGGQNVNKTESAVRITHIPTGIVVSCQTEKAQLQNKEICMRMIRAKVLAFYQEKQDTPGTRNGSSKSGRENVQRRFAPTTILRTG